MSKGNNQRAWKIIGVLTPIIITIILIASGIVLGWGKFIAEDEALGKRIDTGTKEVNRLEDFGCIPARKTSMDIALIKKDVGQLRKDVDSFGSEQRTMRKQMQEDKKEIIKAIKSIK